MPLALLGYHYLVLDQSLICMVLRSNCLHRTLVINFLILRHALTGLDGGTPWRAQIQRHERVTRPPRKTGQRSLSTQVLLTVVHSMPGYCWRVLHKYHSSSTSCETEPGR